MPSARAGICCWLGEVPYRTSLALQERLRTAVIAGDHPETLLLTTHPPVITLGRSADDKQVLVPATKLHQTGTDLVRISRGGGATYHGPGQLVGYPIFYTRQGIRRHVLDMVTALASVLRTLGIVAKWNADRPGLWVGDEKICAFGVHVKKRVTIHGFALNVATDLLAFAQIVPCGLAGFGVTSIERVLGKSCGVSALVPSVRGAFEGSFGMVLRSIDPTQLELLSESTSA